ncbi:hypothetical protein C8R46DRAFT_647426 [Mycena filopes]|nr:hypothetical protein C8R46DRAFT_306513 [Mycena filopes]KAJ7179764.1 hypothetical protein C8R46DRAFT_647426 [Mycena filopes]
MSSPASNPSFSMPVAIDYAALTTSSLVGGLLAFMLGGILIVQSYIYHICFPQDRIGVKLYVYLVVLLLMAALALTAFETYASFGPGFGDIRRYLYPHGVNFYAGLVTICIVSVQLFFCYRIVIIKRSMWPLAVFTALMAVGKTACSIAFAALYQAGGNDVHSHRHVLSTYFVHFSLISNVVTAVLISLSTAYAMLSSSMTRSTRVVVNNILRLIIETNAVTSLVEIVAIVLYAVYPGTTYFNCPSEILAYMYGNMLLATLNHRAIPGAPSFTSGDVHEVDEQEIPTAGSAESVHSMRFAPVRVVPKRASALTQEITEVRRTEGGALTGERV